jgi:excisionase family DNA binding protein
MKTDHQASQPQDVRSELLTVTEAADCLRLKVSTIRAWVLRRRIPFIKLGGKRVFFRRADLDALIKASIVPAKRDAA